MQFFKRSQRRKTMPQRTEKQDIYSRITNQIVSHLEKGVRPWVRPWNAEHAAGRITRPLRHNRKPYSGINVLSLWASALARNFAAPIWMTFKQALELDAHIRKGEKGSLVVYTENITRKETDEKTGDEVEWEIPFLKGYTVFNVEQIEGLPDVYYAKAGPTLDPVARIEHAEKFFAALGATIRHGGNQAFYSVAADAIQMPAFESFQDADSYYATLAHECTHWTGSKTRLNRDFGGHRFGSEGYAVEDGDEWSPLAVGDDVGWAEVAYHGEAGTCGYFGRFADLPCAAQRFAEILCGAALVVDGLSVDADEVGFDVELRLRVDDGVAVDFAESPA